MGSRRKYDGVIGREDMNMTTFSIDDRVITRKQNIVGNIVSISCTKLLIEDDIGEIHGWFENTDVRKHVQ